MAKIEVKLEADYGCDCCMQRYGSTETLEIEISEAELDSLRKIGGDKISRRDVVAAIDGSKIILKSLLDKIDDACYNMIEEYWLFEAYNECLEECLSEAMENDMSEDIFTPSISVEEFIEAVKNNEINYEGLEFGYFEDIEDDYDLDDEDDAQYVYNSYILNEYYDWVRGNVQDHAFVAERVGVDLDACRDDEVNYTITID